MNMPILSVNAMSKIYPGVIALDKVDFEIRKGEVHALVGENGAGKSTLIKCITGAERPTEGTIIFDNKKYSHISPNKQFNMGFLLYIRNST